MARRYWLMKVEPAAYTIANLERDGRTCWEGVRNYQARNLLRDELEVGDGVLFYASNATPSGVAGIAEVARAGYPDPTQFERGHHYYDPKARPDAPTWYTVDLKFVERFGDVVSLAEIKANPDLRGMMVVKRGVRLSVQPVAAAEFATVRAMGRVKRPGS
jgi:predicted RNA-binding protein with PUA-like domain